MDALRKKTDEASTDDVAVEENQGGEGMEAGIAEGGDSVGKTELDKAESDEVKVSVVLPAFLGYFSGLNWCSNRYWKMSHRSIVLTVVIGWICGSLNLVLGS